MVSVFEFTPAGGGRVFSCLLIDVPRSGELGQVQRAHPMSPVWVVDDEVYKLGESKCGCEFRVVVEELSYYVEESRIGHQKLEKTILWNVLQDFSQQFKWNRCKSGFRSRGKFWFSRLNAGAACFDSA